MKKAIKITLTLFITLIIVLGFALPLNPLGNWYQQFMPNLNGRTISDIIFLDSLTGWAVTPYRFQNDTAFVLKTTNSGDNWFIQFAGTGQFVGRNKIKFLNNNIGFTCGNDHFTGSTKITKTTNGGNTWFSINDPTTAVYEDMVVLSEDTIWLVASSSLSGGVFRTTNGGLNWVQQYSAGSQNPEKIYMFNARIGFISDNSGTPSIRRTTNGGLNWNLNVSGAWFNDIIFTDSLTGWFGNSEDKIYKTTDGSNTWITQYLPTGGIILTSNISRLSLLNKDTIWGAGGQLFYGGGRFRAMLYRTTNGGNNWLFNIPDTSFGIPALGFIQFINKNNAWSYNSYNGIHTTNGGDTTFLVGLQQISNEVPKEFRLYQNYPNPFNPNTNIKYQLTNNNSNVKLLVFDITGKEVITLVNQEQNAGTYEVDFSGNGYSSGVYFYSLIVGGMVIDTKKMILIK